MTLHAANVLIKVNVGDLEFRDTEGGPFKISSHLYRHAGQTVARYDAPRCVTIPIQPPIG